MKEASSRLQQSSPYSYLWSDYTSWAFPRNSALMRNCYRLSEIAILGGFLGLNITEISYGGMTGSAWIPKDFRMSQLFLWIKDTWSPVRVILRLQWQFFWSQKSSYTKKHRIEWRSLTVTLLRRPSTVTVSGRGLYCCFSAKISERHTKSPLPKSSSQTRCKIETNFLTIN